MTDLSLVLPIYNEKRVVLLKTLDSIFSQSLQDFELIIVDDGAENYSDINQYYLTDPRVKYFNRGKKLGITSALNFGISKSTSPIIARVDSDDIQVTDRLLLQLNYMKSHPQVGVLGSSVYRLIGDELFGIRNFPVNHCEIVRKSAINNPMCHGTIMIRKDIFYKYGFYNENYTTAEDYELWMRLIKNGVKFHNLNIPLICYRIPGYNKRPISNWINNLKIKIHFFNKDHILLRIYGVVIVSIFIIMPNFIQRQLYKFYTKQN